MIKGLKHWTELKRYCDQTTNVIEKARKDVNSKHYLESCNVESIYIGMDCMGDIDTYGNPTWIGIDCQPSDFMFCHINWNKYNKEYVSGDELMDNEYIYMLAKMLNKMGYKTYVKKEPGEEFFKTKLPENIACVINIPGHYCCGIAWDFDINELIYHNPWPQDERNKNNGRHERLKINDPKIPIRYGLSFWK